MRRRRLLLIVVVGLAAVAGLWAYLAWDQYRLERQLVGTWEKKYTHVWNEEYMELLPDGVFRLRFSSLPSSDPPAYWSVFGQEMITSPQPQRLPRVLWPLAQRLGWRPNGLNVWRYEVAGDRLTLFDTAGNPNPWTRVRDK